MAADKARRYDRQLRIWGEAGQSRLESAHVCLLNCGPTGSEALKNLVLGGIAAFTIVDDAAVTQEDLENKCAADSAASARPSRPPSFLVQASALGGSRAACVSQLLTELNEAVSGAFVEEQPAALVGNADFFRPFTLVIATQARLQVHALAPLTRLCRQVCEADVLRLDESCRAHGVPLIVARSYGLFGQVRNSVAEHTVVESKPDNVLEDLRVASPWPELSDFCASFDLAACDDLTHRHVPYVVLLIKTLAEWRAAHGGAAPAAPAERAAFKEALRALERSPLDPQENVKEALAAAHKAWAAGGVPAELRLLLDDPAVSAAAASPCAATPDFWLLAAALKAFIAAEGSLLLDGMLPDMTSTTDTYVHLQRLYAARAAADVDALEAHLAPLLQAAGRPALPRELVRSFAKNAAHLHVLRTPRLALELGSAAAAGGRSAAARGEALSRALGAEDPERASAAIHLLLRAADRFAAQYGRYPGVHDSELEEDAGRLKAVACGLLAELGLASAGALVPDDLVSETCRYGASELHCVAAIVGAVASQEAIKLITHQFVPLAAPLLYNGITSCTNVLTTLVL